MTGTAVVEQDEAIVEALVAGRSVRVVQREFSLTVTELDQALERCFPLDTAARLRTIRSDLSRLDRLIEKFYLKALAGNGDVDSATLVVRAWERKSALLGLDAVQRIDLQIVQAPQAETRHDKIRRVFWELRHPGQRHLTVSRRGPPLNAGRWTASHSWAVRPSSAPPRPFADFAPALLG